MVKRINPPGKPLLSERKLQAMRLYAKSIADIEASDRSMRTTIDDGFRGPPVPFFLKNGPCPALSAPNQQSECSNSLVEKPSEQQEAKENNITVGNGQSEERDEQETNTSQGIDRKQVHDLNNLASGYALRGDEATALKLYKSLVSLTTSEVARIQKKMEEVTENEPEYLKSSVYRVLSDERNEVALIIAEIKAMMAVVYERTGDFDRAIRSCNDAMDVYRRQTRDRNQQNKLYQHVKENLGMMHHMAEKMKRAKESFSTRKFLHAQTLDLHSKMMGASSPDERKKIINSIFELLSTVLTLELECLGEYHPQIAETLALLSKIHFENDDVPQALVSMQRSVSVAEIALGTKHPRTGEKYHGLARLFDRANRDKYDKTHAFLYYEKAVDAFREAEGDQSMPIGSILNDQGILLVRDHRYDESIEKFRDSLTAYQSGCQVVENKELIETAQVWRNLAECLVQKKEWQQAAFSFSSALGVQRRSRKQFEKLKPKDAAPAGPLPHVISDESIADTMKRLGKVYMSMNEYEKAEAVLLEGLTIFQNSVSAAKSSPLDLALKQDGIASFIFCLAEAKEAGGDYNQAIKLYDESLELRYYSDKVRPKGQKMNNIHIIMCLAGIGKMHFAMGDDDKALKALNEAILSARKDGLPTSHPIFQMLLDHSRKISRKIDIANSSETDLEEEETEQFFGKKEHVFFDVKLETDLDKGLSQDAEKTKVSGEGTRSCTNFSLLLPPTIRLEKKAQNMKKKGDINGALDARIGLLRLRKDELSRSRCTKKAVTKSTRKVAETLVDIAKLHLIKGESTKAKLCFQEALTLYKSSGSSVTTGSVQEIQQQLDRLNWMGQNGTTERRSHKTPSPISQVPGSQPAHKEDGLQEIDESRQTESSESTFWTKSVPAPTNQPLGKGSPQRTSFIRL